MQRILAEQSRPNPWRQNPKQHKPTSKRCFLVDVSPCTPRRPSCATARCDARRLRRVTEMPLRRTERAAEVAQAMHPAETAG
eukprot:scaffold270_cov121-Isochrysis_galbana.AAC.21